MQIQSSSTDETPRFTRCHQPSPCLQFAGERSQRRKLRIGFSPRRESCATKRAMLAALREAELDEWRSTGGDFLRSHELE